MHQSRQTGFFIWQIYLIIWIAGLFYPLWPLASLTCLGIIFFTSPTLWQFYRILLGSLIFLISAIFISLNFFHARELIKEAPDWINSAVPVRVCGIVENVQFLPEKRLRLIIGKIKNTDDNTTLPGLCLWSWDNPPAITPLAGQSVCITRPIRRISEFSDHFQNDYQASWYAKNIYWRMWSKEADGFPRFSGNPYFSKLRESLRSRFLVALNGHSPDEMPQSKAILLALIFGDKSALALKTINLFASATLAHSLALSGQHLCLAGLFSLIFICILGRIKPAIYLCQPKAVLIALASIPLALFYLWLGNAPPSLVRAAGMLVIFSLWLFRGRPFKGIDVLCAILFLVLIFDPFAIYDISLQLSVLCVCILILASPFLAKIRLRKTFIGSSAIQALLYILLVSFIIQLFLLPLSLLRFQLAGFLFALNIIWLPLLAFWVLPLSAFGLIFSALNINIGYQIAHFFLDCASWPCSFIINLLNFLNSHGIIMEPAFLRPHWTTLLAFALIFVALFQIYNGASGKMRQARNLLFIALGLLSVGPILREIDWHDSSISLEALDVGQGQAILLKFPHNGKILIDGGGGRSRRFDPGKTVVATQISSNSPPVIASIINTHPDLDHLGGLFYLLEKFKVPSLFHNGRKGNSAWQSEWEKHQKKHNAQILTEGDELVLGDPALGLKLEVLHPPKYSEKPWKGNSASIVLKLSKHGKGLALLTGDAEKDTLKYLCSSDKNLEAKVIIAPHHGSDRSLWADFYKKAKPELVIASCGYLNRYNYPGRKLANFLKKNEIPLLDTGNNGKITIKLDKNPKLTVERGDMPKITFDKQGNKQLRDHQDGI